MLFSLQDIKKSTGLCKLWRDKEAREALTEYVNIFLTDSTRPRQSYLFGLIQVSNLCRMDCEFCPNNGTNRQITRYRMSNQEILNRVSDIARFGIHRIILRAGQVEEKDVWLLDIVENIKFRYPSVELMVEVGALGKGFMRRAKDCGLDGVLLRFFSSDRVVRSALGVQDGYYKERIACLEAAADIGLDIGTGASIGIPGQNIASVARDILFTYSLGPKYIIPGHRSGLTPLVDSPALDPKDDLCTYISLLKVLMPEAVIFSPNEMKSHMSELCMRSLQSGANAIILDFTPLPYKKFGVSPAQNAIDFSLKQLLNTKKFLVSSGMEII